MYVIAQIVLLNRLSIDFEHSHLVIVRVGIFRNFTRNVIYARSYRIDKITKYKNTYKETEIF